MHGFIFQLKFVSNYLSQYNIFTLISTICYEVTENTPRKKTTATNMRFCSHPSRPREVILQDLARWRLSCKILRDGGYLARSCEMDVIRLFYTFPQHFIYFFLSCLTCGKLRDASKSLLKTMQLLIRSLKRCIVFKKILQASRKILQDNVHLAISCNITLNCKNLARFFKIIFLDLIGHY